MQEGTALNLRDRSEKSLHSPARVATVAFFLGGLYLLARILIAAHGNASALIVAGSQYVNENKLGMKIPIIQGSGYDGQFYFRLALDPFSTSRSYSGITFDSPIRAQRILYPLLSWLISFGDPHLVPFAMILVELLAWTAIAFFAALLARESGRHPSLGLAIAAFPGYFFSVGRDLTEPTASALLLAAIYYILKNQYWLASLLLSLSVLAKETGMVLVLSLGIYWFLTLIAKTRHARKGALIPIYTWLIPLSTFMVWQFVISLVEQHEPLRSDISSNLSLPFVAMLRGIWERIQHPLPIGNSLWVIQFASLVLLVILTFARYRSNSIPALFEIAFAAMIALSVSLSGEIWPNDNYLRSIDLVWVFGWLIIFYSKRPIRWWYSVLFVATALSAAQLVVFI